MSDLDAIREAIAVARARIEQERAFTIERVERLRRFSRPDALKEREREEWQHFYDRTRYLEREVEEMIKAAATYLAWQSPAPIIIAADTPE